MPREYQPQLAVTALLCLLSTTSLAQQSATGTASSSSTSESGAIAISGSGGAGGAGGAGGQGGTAVATGGRGGRGGQSTSAIIFNSGGDSTSTIKQEISGTQTVNSNSKQEISGTQTVKTAPGVVAPGLSAAGIETCLGSISGSGSVVGFGASFGTTLTDPGCAARLDARTLWSMGLKGAAVARMCLTPEVYASMPDVCEKFRPVAPNGGAYAAAPAEAAKANGMPASIELIDGRTGLARWCDNYDANRQKCLQWKGEPPWHPPAAKPKPKVAAAPPPPKRTTILVPVDPAAAPKAE